MIREAIDIIAIVGAAAGAVLVLTLVCALVAL
jgi:hypothetical protein